MVRIRQHGESAQLFDLTSFFTDVDHFYKINAWRIQVTECLGKDASELERTAEAPATVTDDVFREAYGGIYQTIDGSFSGLLDGQRQFEIVAVDSSYWEVSASPALEAHMLQKYGAYSPNGA